MAGELDAAFAAAPHGNYLHDQFRIFASRGKSAAWRPRLPRALIVDR